MLNPDKTQKANQYHILGSDVHPRTVIFWADGTADCNCHHGRYNSPATCYHVKNLVEAGAHSPDPGRASSPNAAFQTLVERILDAPGGRELVANLLSEQV